MLGEVYHPDLLPDAVAREVDHNVVALGNAQLVQLGEHHRTRQQVPVVGDLNHRRAVRQRDLEKARHARVEDAEAVLAPLHLVVRLVGEVHGHHVAQESVEVEDVHGQLTVRIESLVGHHEINVVIEIPPGLGGAAGQPKVHPVVDCFIAAIKRAVDVGHRGVALVNVLGREAEHMVVEPVSAHRLVPVARDLVNAPAISRAACSRIGGCGVDRPESREHNGPVVVVKLAREEERSGESVVLRPVVCVVRMGRDRVPPEACVLGDVERQLVVMAQQDRLAVPYLGQLGRNGPVERPHIQRVLGRPSWVELQRYGRSRVDARIEARWNTGVIVIVGPSPLLRDLNCDLGRELCKALVCPDRPRRSPLDRSRVTCSHSFQRSIQGLLCLIGVSGRSGIQDRHSIPRQHVEAWHRLAEGLDAKQRTGRQPGWNVGVVGIDAPSERAQAPDRQKQSGRREEAHLDQVTTSDLSVRMGFDYLPPILSRRLGFSQPSLRRFGRQKEISFAHCFFL